MHVVIANYPCHESCRKVVVVQDGACVLSVRGGDSFSSTLTPVNRRFPWHAILAVSPNKEGKESVSSSPRRLRARGTGGAASTPLVKYGGSVPACCDSLMLVRCETKCASGPAGESSEPATVKQASCLVGLMRMSLSSRGDEAILEKDGRGLLFSSCSCRYNSLDKGGLTSHDLSSLGVENPGGNPVIFKVRLGEVDTLPAGGRRAHSATGGYLRNLRNRVGYLTSRLCFKGEEVVFPDAVKSVALEGPNFIKRTNCSSNMSGVMSVTNEVNLKNTPYRGRRRGMVTISILTIFVHIPPSQGGDSLRKRAERFTWLGGWTGLRWGLRLLKQRRLAIRTNDVLSDTVLLVRTRSSSRR